MNTYSVDSIKRTVLLKVLFKIFIGVSIKHTVHWDYVCIALKTSMYCFYVLTMY